MSELSRYQFTPGESPRDGADQVSVEGVPVGADDLAVKTGVHGAGGDRSEGCEILIITDKR